MQLSNIQLSDMVCTGKFEINVGSAQKLTWNVSQAYFQCSPWQVSFITTHY